MTYKPGRMGLSEGAALVFIISIPWVFLSLPATDIDIAASLAWLMPVLSGTGVLGSMYILIRVMNYVPGDLFEVSRSLLGSIGAYMVALVCLAAFSLDAFVLLRQYAENTLLTALPQIEFGIAIFLYAAVAGVLAYIGVEGLARSGYILAPFAIIALILVWLLVSPTFNYNNLFPLFGKGLDAIIPAGLMLSGANAGVLGVAVLAPALHRPSTVWLSTLYGLAGSTFIKAVSVLSFTLVFSYSAGREKLLPFFEMARLIYLSRYIQRVEAVFILLWVILGILAIALNLYMALYIITRIFNMPSPRPIIPLAVFTLAQTAMIPSDVGDIIALNIFLIKYFKTIVILGIPLVLFIAFIFKQKKGKKKLWSAG
ncbi:GerAB/ArcD/ProY family transporter [Sporomusa aerivorans]|uniref:GerAB/ArcD/ProY family transporter n=1 Tax=Sporomusa aerivorans TaxID=204936 RepID=UPI00352AC56B